MRRGALAGNPSGDYLLAMKPLQTALPGVVIVEPQVFEDKRGVFFESYHATR